MKENGLDRRILVGIALVGMSMLMLELVLTRIFSVTLWYHFAFMAISIALLGISISGIFVYLFIHLRSPEHTLRRLAASSLVFSVTTVLALVAQLRVEFVPNLSPESVLLLSQIYLVVALPFFFGGICISLALTQFSNNVSRIYFADLAGAGVGCFLVIPVLSILTGPDAIIFAAILASAASWQFASTVKWRLMRGVSLALGVALLGLLIANSQMGFLKISFAKMGKEKGVLLEKWNPFSRVVLSESGSFDKNAKVTGWGPTESYSGETPNSMIISIDAGAATPIYEFDGDLSKMEVLKHDATSIAYYLRKGGSALIIGPGGGKDVLTALLFGMRPIRGVEINPSVVEIVKEDYAEYGGRLYDREGVDIVIDEARSYITRSKENFDIIQASLIDSWAATAAGAYVLSENHLYTMEAFKEYYEHLTDRGILTISRFFPAHGGQTLRLVPLAYETLKSIGIAKPENHLVVIKSGILGTVLLKKSEFTSEELATIRDLSESLNFQVVADPTGSSHEVISALFNAKSSESFYRDLPYDLVPPVDDKPFFFHMLRFKDLMHRRVRAAKPSLTNEMFGQAGLATNDTAIFVLGSLMLIVTVFSLLFIFGPLWTFRREALRQTPGKFSLLLYFTCLGIGFMMIEVPLMQKLLLFLGHPIYALSVTLFGLLIFSGIGSYFTGYMAEEKHYKWLSTILGGIVVLLVVYIMLLPVFINKLISMPTMLKVPLVVLAMLPLGLLMGMPFPIGIKLMDRRAHDMVPWVWGVNGATSVFASVLSVAVAISWGFTGAMWLGLCSYITALAIVVLSRGFR